MNRVHDKILASLLVVFAFFIQGCGPTYHIRVDSISAPTYESGKYYMLFPAKKGTHQNDLQFLEFSEYIHRALIERGYTETKEFEKVDLAIFLNYGIGNPQTSSYTYSLPVYGSKGGGTSTFIASTTSSSGYSNTTGTITTAPKFGVVGANTYSGTNTSYFRFLSIEAIDAKTYRKTKENIPFWKTTISSSGSSGDLRRVFPVLVAASLPYLGTNTKRQIKVRVGENSRKVNFIKGRNKKP